MRYDDLALKVQERQKPERKVKMKETRSKSLILSLVCLLIALMIGFSNVVGAAGTLSKDEVSAIVNTSTDQKEVTSPYIQAANQARESVVGVNNYQTSQDSYFGYGFGFGFENPRPRSEGDQVAATGSGVVISKYGHVLTNYHVIKGADKVTVSVGDKEKEAIVVGADSNLDIAILLAKDLDLPAAPLGDSDKLQIGEYAIVIGNPLGKEFERTVTVGVVSAVKRTVQDSTRDRYGRRTTIDNQMIQVDAAINSGNSGGGMFNILGQLQGIPARKYDSSGFFGGASVDNIGMCIPINSAKPLIESVLSSYDPSNVNSISTNDSQNEADSSKSNSSLGQVAKPRLGVSVQTMPSNYIGVSEGILPQGAYVSKVEKNSPAQNAGIQVGDIIVEINEKVIKDSQGLVDELTGKKEGDKVKVKLYRVEGLTKALDDYAKLKELKEGKYIDLEATLAIIDNRNM